MPNPITLVLDRNAHLRIGRGGAWSQRVFFKNGGVEELVTLVPAGNHGLDLAAGTWTITHEFKRSIAHEWERGRGKRLQPHIIGFDDGAEGEGDNDYDDVRIGITYV